MNLESESSLSARLLAINIPKNNNYLNAKNFFQQGEDDGIWEYEEACMSEKHQRDLL